MDGLFFRANNFDAFGESSTNRTVHPEKDNGNGFAKLDTNTFGHCLVPNNGFFRDSCVLNTKGFLPVDQTDPETLVDRRSIRP